MGKRCYTDVTIVHSWGKYILTNRTTTGFSAARENSRKRKYLLQMSADLGYLFRPFAIDVFGRWGDQAKKILEASIRC